MLSFRIALLALLLALTPGAALAATHDGFQVQVDGLYGSPMGTYASADGAQLTDYFASGAGFAISASQGLSRWLHVGVRVATFSSRKSRSLTFDELMLPGGGLPAGSGPFDANRQLTVQPVVGVLQYLHTLRPGTQLFLEGGGGLISFRERVKVTSPSRDLFIIAGYQQEPAWTVGAGASVRVARHIDLVGAANYYKASVGEGDIWAPGDDPAFLTATLGLRYPRY